LLTIRLANQEPVAHGVVLVAGVLVEQAVPTQQPIQGQVVVVALAYPILLCSWALVVRLVVTSRPSSLLLELPMLMELEQVVLVDQQEQAAPLVVMVPLVRASFGSITSNLFGGYDCARVFADMLDGIFWFYFGQKCRSRMFARDHFVPFRDRCFNH